MDDDWGYPYDSGASARPAQHDGASQHTDGGVAGGDFEHQKWRFRNMGDPQ